jgi:hypothetical protein
MKLETFLSKTGWDRTFLAWKIGVNECSVTRYLTGSRIPSPDVMVAIYKVTKGKVAPNDFYQLPTKAEL